MALPAFSEKNKNSDDLGWLQTIQSYLKLMTLSLHSLASIDSAQRITSIKNPRLREALMEKVYNIKKEEKEEQM